MLKKLLIAAIVSTSIVACSSTKPPEPAPEPAPAPAPAPEPVASAPAPAPAPVVSNHNSVYFGFNLYDIKEGYNGVIKANADSLSATPGSKVQVQGNTDDIGSVEYNLALGQRRADSVKKVLIADGVKKAQIETVSYGKLKPKYPNDTDASRAQNRRADMVYKGSEPKGYSVDANGLPMVNGDFYNGSVVEGVQP